MLAYVFVKRSDFAENFINMSEGAEGAAAPRSFGGAGDALKPKMGIISNYFEREEHYV